MAFVPLGWLNIFCPVWTASYFPKNIATPDPTPCSFLLPSLNAWIVLSWCSITCIILTSSAGCGQLLSSSSLSIRCFWLPFAFLILYCLTTSSILKITGVVPARMHSASLDCAKCFGYSYIYKSFQSNILWSVVFIFHRFSLDRSSI